MGSFAVLVVVVMLMATITSVMSVDSEASSDSWECRVTLTVDDNGYITVTTKYAENGATLSDTNPVKGFDDGAVTKTSGDWAFDKETGYGPFGSFYAAFDPANGNTMVCHLNPDDLTKSIEGEEDISEKNYNIMWCIPRIYLSLADEGKTLVMASDDSKGGTLAPAFTVGGKDYNYLALGVYEAYADGDKLYSRSGVLPTVDTSVESFQVYAANSGAGEGGHSMIWNFYQWQLYRFCSLAVMQNFDSQAQIGMGNVNSDSKQNTGTTDTGGPYCGTKVASRSGEKLFIENAWGNVMEYLGDAYWSNGLYAGQNSVQNSSSSLVSSVTKTNVVPGLGWDSGLRGISPDTVHLDAWGLPTALGRTGPDYLYTNQSNKAVCVSGLWGDTDYAGLSVLTASSLFGEYYTGSRLAFLFTTDQIVISTPKVTYDHSNLETLLKEFGYSEDLMSELPEKATGTTRYEDLGEVAAFKHVGWMIYGKQYSVTSEFVDSVSHTAVSVWVGLPAVTYDHSQLIKLSGDRYSEAGLNNGLEIRGHDRYEQLPDRAGYTHIGWEVNGKTVDPTATFVTHQSHIAKSLWAPIPTVIFDHTNLTGIVGLGAEGVSELAMSMPIKGNSNYPELPDAAGYRHIGWEVDGKTLEATAKLESQITHTAKSLWVEIPTVVFDHSNLTDIVGKDAKGVSDLETSMPIEGHSSYPQLPNTAGYRHIGWLIEKTGEKVGPTAVLELETTHKAKSLWEKISVTPIIPDGTESEEQGAVVPIVVEEEHGFWSQNNGKSLLIIAIIAAIIAELAVLSISRRK